MPRFKKSIEIKAPPEKVFAVLDDSPNFPKWQRGVKEVRITSNNGSRLEDRTGEVAHFVAEFGGFKLEWESEVVKWVKNRLFVIESRSGLLRPRGNDIVEPIKGGTKVTWDMQYDMPFFIIGKVIDTLLFRRIFERQVERNLENLKKLLES